MNRNNIDEIKNATVEAVNVCPNGKTGHLVVLGLPTYCLNCKANADHNSK